MCHTTFNILGINTDYRVDSITHVSISVTDKVIWLVIVLPHQQ